MKLRSALIVCVAPLMLASLAAAEEGCKYNDIAYSHGAKVCQAGTQYRCADGAWQSLLVQCKADSAPPSCEYNGTNFSPGATSCQSGTQYRCTEGTWSSLSVACGAGAPAPAPMANDAPRPPRTCMLAGTTVASASTVCKEGSTYLCNDGDWRNLGTPCQ